MRRLSRHLLIVGALVQLAAGVFSFDIGHSSAIDKPEVEYAASHNHYVPNEGKGHDRDATREYHQRAFDRHNECRIYTTEMAYFANKAVISGCSADLVLACKRKLYHFDKYDVRVYGGGAYVHYVDIAGFNRMNYYLIGVKVPCRYKGSVSVQIRLPNVHVPELVFEKAAFVPIKTTGVINDFHQIKGHHQVYDQWDYKKHSTGRKSTFRSTLSDVFGDYLGTEDLEHAPNHSHASTIHWAKSGHDLFKGHGHSYGDYLGDAGYSRISHGIHGNKHVGHLSSYL